MNNKETISNIYSAFGRGDIPAVLDALTPDAQWTEAAGFPYAGTYTGPDEILQSVFMKLGSEWDNYVAVAHELVAEGDTVVAVGEYSGTYKATGKSFVAPMVHVWKLADGKVTRFHQHTDTVLVQAALK